MMTRTAPCVLFLLLNTITLVTARLVNHENGKLVGLRRLKDDGNAFCGGTAGVPCPNGYTCVNSGDCDVGRADCEGHCQRICNSTLTCPDGFECFGGGCTFGSCSDAYCKQQFCGGIAGIPCPVGFTCEDDPNDGCDPNSGGADCGGVCEKQICGEEGMLKCPLGFTCKDDLNCDGDTNNCPGVCEPTCPQDTCGEGQICVDSDGTLLCLLPITCDNVRCAQGTECVIDENGDPQCIPLSTPSPSVVTSVPTRALDTTSMAPSPTTLFCGGIVGIPCPTGYECFDDPSDGCDPQNGGADCSGICRPQLCAGIAGIKCPEGFLCTSTSDCDPQTTSDCGGICLAQCDDTCPLGTVCVNDTDGPACVVTLICQEIACEDEHICVLDEKDNPECVPNTETATPTETTSSTPTASELTTSPTPASTITPSTLTNAPTDVDSTLEPSSNPGDDVAVGLIDTSSGVGSFSKAVAAILIQVTIFVIAYT